MEKYIFVFCVLLLSLNFFTCVLLPELDLSTSQLIEYWGYPAEVYSDVLTKDDYLLTLQRIPHGKSKPKTKYQPSNIENQIPNAENQPLKNDNQRPVFLVQHAFLDVSSSWVINLPNDSLGFMLADAGFDVWLGNARGNTYSKGHKYLNVNSSAFWDFSLDELAKYDLPAMIDYILNKTNQTQLYYVGHSQGTIMAFAGFSESMQLQRKVKAHFALAPVTRIATLYTPVKRFAAFETELSWAAYILGIHEVLPANKVIRILNKKICRRVALVCDLLIFLVAGYDQKNWNDTRLPVYIEHTPAGTSTKNLMHYLQFINSKLFQKYDYGWVKNEIRYGRKHPPQYHIDSINVPTYLFSGTDDWLSTPTDVKWTARNLPNVVENIVIPGYNHLDFTWGTTAGEKIYKKIIKFTQELEKEQPLDVKHNVV